jgi:N-acyl-D-aspartate/D-glutamate deacylase
MSADFDLVIRGGSIADGGGGEIFTADVAVSDGRIAAIGVISGAGAEEIDASDLLVTPGFVDVHTHYDGQVSWENRLSPSSDHGVTTVVTGNCGVGFAPCRPADREGLVALMAGVEDIPEVVMTEGLAWNWESFPEYLDAVAARPHDVDIAAMVPHSALRVYAMGERAVWREAATPADVARMAELVREAMASGAIGVGTSRAIQQRSVHGEPIPTVGAAEEELLGIMQPIAEAGGVFQLLSDFEQYRDVEGEFAMMRRLVERTGVPMSFTLNQRHSHPEGWRQLLALLAEANAAGLPMLGQVLGRPTGLLLGHELSTTPFDTSPTYAALKALPLSDKLSHLRREDVRSAVIAEASADPGRSLEQMFELDTSVDYEPVLSESIAAKAARAGKMPYAYAYDLLLEEGGRKIIFDPAQNYADGSLSAPYEMMCDPNTILGLGDGGAHYGLICDASFPTTMLTYWVRDRVRGPRLPLEAVVKKLTSDTATAVGLRDRGRLAAGYKADLNLIDHSALTLEKPSVVYDLPAGGRRIVQKARGYRATIVSGKVTYRDGVETGALPGQVVRGPRHMG